MLRSPRKYLWRMPSMWVLREHPGVPPSDNGRISLGFLDRFLARRVRVDCRRVDVV